MTGRLQRFFFSPAAISARGASLRAVAAAAGAPAHMQPRQLRVSYVSVTCQLRVGYVESGLVEFL